MKSAKKQPATPDSPARQHTIRMAEALPPDRQSIAAAYALGIRDGLQLAADIRQKIKATKEMHSVER